MRVLDVVEFFGRLKGLTRSHARKAGIEWLDRMGLADWRRSRIEQLSKGMQQKVQFITTVIHEPQLLILDEPASGLDPVNQEVLRSTILDARNQGRTVLLSTHNMTEAETLCDAVCIIAAGRKVLDGNVRELRRASGTNRWAVDYDDPPGQARETVARFALQGGVTATACGWEVDLAPSAEARDLIAALAALPTPPCRIARVDPSLHEIFVARVGGSAARPTRRD
ncbi:MAG: ATP-binding cassette domain-containing protein, partial [Gemmatimonadetes bacterium]|nr:ATP-binding cassette domain-containing protein [Gemmatimonadota bacterium]